MKNLFQIFLLKFLLSYLALGIIAIIVVRGQIDESIIGELADRRLTYNLMRYGAAYLYKLVNLTPKLLPLAMLIASTWFSATVAAPVRKQVYGAGICAIMISAVCFMFHNFVVPRVNLLYFSDDSFPRPFSDVPEGRFVDLHPDYEGSYSVYIAHKNDQFWRGMMLYREYNNISHGYPGEEELIMADSAKFTELKDGAVLELWNGSRVQERCADTGQYPLLTRQAFGYEKLEFPYGIVCGPSFVSPGISGLYLGNIAEITAEIKQRRQEVIDMNMIIPEITKPYYDFQFAYNRYQPIADRGLADSIMRDTIPPDYLGLGESLPAKDSIFERAIIKIAQLKDFSMSNQERIRQVTVQIDELIYMIHLVFAHAVSCLLMLLVGLPLGWRMRKQNITWPLVAALLVAIGFYLCPALIQALMTDEMMTGRIWVVARAWMGAGLVLLAGMVLLTVAKQESVVPKL